MQTPTTTRHGPTCLANVCFTQCGTRGDEAVELAFPRGSCTWVFECAVGRAYAIKNSPSDAYDTERWVRAAAGPTYATHVDSVVPKTTLLLVPIPGLVAKRARQNETVPLAVHALYCWSFAYLRVRSSRSHATFALSTSSRVCYTSMAILGGGPTCSWASLSGTAR